MKKSPLDHFAFVLCVRVLLLNQWRRFTRFRSKDIDGKASSLRQLSCGKTVIAGERRFNAFHSPIQGSGSHPRKIQGQGLHSGGRAVQQFQRTRASSAKEIKEFVLRPAASPSADGKRFTLRVRNSIRCMPAELAGSDVPGRYQMELRQIPDRARQQKCWRWDSKVTRRIRRKLPTAIEKSLSTKVSSLK